MKIGILSDTHGNALLTKKALGVLQEGGMPDKIYHLGDDYKDMALLEGMAKEILVVPGVYCAEYHFDNVPNVLFDEAEGWRIALVHRREDLRPDDINNADIILYGHTHLYEAVKINGKVFINPGHLKKQFDKGREPSFAIVELTRESIRVRITGPEGEKFEEVEISKANRQF